MEASLWNKYLRLNILFVQNMAMAYCLRLFASGHELLLDAGDLLCQCCYCTFLNFQLA